MNARGPRRAAARRSQAEIQESAGEVLFKATCETCHDGSRPLPLGGLKLELSSAVHASDPTNIINVILRGLPPAPGERSPIMPAYDAVMTDAQIVDLLRYMRATLRGPTCPRWWLISDPRWKTFLRIRQTDTWPRQPSPASE